MKDSIVKTVRFFLIKSIGLKNIEKLITLLARIAGIDLLMLAYHEMGILKYWNSAISGEDFVINSVLKKYFKEEKLIMFDVGANVGNYAKKLKNKFSNAVIYAFEPNPNTFEILNRNLAYININCYQVGLSSTCSKHKIYTYVCDKHSEHTSVYKNVLLDLHKANELVEIEFKNTTIDEFCQANKVERIDFIKIDTEGHEMEILKGASKMISEAKISVIQFEFNEMNVISRVFLKDFYELLYDRYEMYRLDTDKLIPLQEYSSKNEIFKFQNILAINRKFATFY